MLAPSNNTINGGLINSTFSVANDLTIGDGYYIILVDTSASRSITLPTPTNGRVITVKDKSGQSEINNITLVRNGSEKIEGIADNRSLSTNWGKWTIVSDGTDWFLI